MLIVFFVNEENEDSCWILTLNEYIVLRSCDFYHTYLYKQAENRICVFSCDGKAGYFHNVFNNEAGDHFLS